MSEKRVHSDFASGQQRSEFAPIETSYLYNQVNNPGVLSLFGSDSTTRKPALENYSELKPFLYEMQNQPIDVSKKIFRPYEASLAKRDLGYALSKYNANFLPSKIRTDGMYERLKSAMHYLPDDMSEMISRYDSSDYHTDYDDIRTSSRGVYDNWPSNHRFPYEYDHAMEIDAEIEKTVDLAKVIPIHEDLSQDIPNSYNPIFTTDHYRATTDNPIMGHDPFFSFVLNDYFEKNNYDIDQPITDREQYSTRNRRRLEENFPTSPVEHETANFHLNHGQKDKKSVYSDSVTEKVFAKKHEFDKHKKGDKKNENDITKHEQKYSGFKDFFELFANKFGAEDYKKDSKLSLRRNKDNGEKRKGFHRVYHKDEYQEDNEFYNNNDNNSKSEEKGSLNAHIGGSEGLLTSHAAAESLGKQKNSFNNDDNAEKYIFDNNHTGRGTTKLFDEHINRYRDVVTQAAQFDNADYSDHY